MTVTELMEIKDKCRSASWAINEAERSLTKKGKAENLKKAKDCLTEAMNLISNTKV